MKEKPKVKPINTKNKFVRPRIIGILDKDKVDLSKLHGSRKVFALYSVMVIENCSNKVMEYKFMDKNLAKQLRDEYINSMHHQAWITYGPDHPKFWTETNSPYEILLH